MAVNLADLGMAEVRDHYLLRERTHHQLRQLFDVGNVPEFVRLALGMTERAGNYSASEHVIGPKILAGSTFAERDVFDLATAIENCPNTNRLPTVIYKAAIPNLKISVGSEIAMMLKPHCHWVGNKRTIWSHLLLKHGMDQRRANQELRLYYQRDDDSEMAYEVWRDLYLRVGPDLLTLGERVAQVARAQRVEPGRLLYLWPDAVATFLFDRFARQ
jgi:hypothetical protein